jgi:hypothetical protein
MTESNLRSSLPPPGRTRLERLICHRRLIVMHGGALTLDPGESPAGLIRIGANSTGEDAAQAVDAMRAAGEQPALVGERFAHGDEFIGWRIGRETLCFGWVTPGERRVGPLRLIARASTVYLYNFHTVGTARHRGLYSSLLLRIRYMLGMQGIRDFVIDADERNLPSLRGMSRAGFRPVASVSFFTLFGHWNLFGSVVPLLPVHPILTAILP